MANLKNLNLLKKLHNIQCAIDKLAKDANGYNYKYTSGDTVLNAIRPLMNQYGLLLKPEIIEVKNAPMEYINNYGKHKKEVLSEVKFKFTWIDIESGETDTGEWSANGMNEFERGIGSAATYAERYYLLKYFHIPSDEDDVDNKYRKQNFERPANNQNKETKGNKKDYNTMSEKEKIIFCQKFITNHYKSHNETIHNMLGGKKIGDLSLKEAETIIEVLKVEKKKGGK